MKKIMILLLVLVTLLSGCVSTHGLPEAVGKQPETEAPEVVAELPEPGALRIKYENHLQSINGMTIVLSTANETGHIVSIGFGMGQIEVTTSEGVYTSSEFMVKIPKGFDELIIGVDNASGDIQKIVIPELDLLDTDGLPKKTIRNVVVYDVENNVHCYEEEIAAAGRSANSGRMIPTSQFAAVNNVGVTKFIPARNPNDAIMSDYSGDEPLFIKVENTLQTTRGLLVLLTFHNNTGRRLSLGWGSCQIEVTTTDGTYYQSVERTEISQGSSQIQIIIIIGASGDIRKFVISDLRLLKENSGLSDKVLNDVVVYDISEGIAFFEGSFDNPIAIYAIIAVIAVAAVIAPIILIILLRKNRKSVKSSDPGQSAGGGEMQFTPPPTMNNAAHQQFMQQEIIRQHMDFAQKSVTPIDQGGFVPPPPPPPPSGF